ncbi:hypothetical protein BAUCODRAFT_29252 [Baudoinia panamericana UAMH 10762]|uniref:Uncharacterized protein n=1 Tax=Baudoinia panamericana (strain UAMH 10762) TaxID=717646 RepID=M2NNR1_BAUPA|nr:uncharacterized protein BAUCODRAFT_29252 [Baudoinia panamericana UAMH 10762]EMD00871.1 hypothetical protein BAUCODRAFT_29252 [Baudoinia panamericana UAMH 10762]
MRRLGRNVRDPATGLQCVLKRIPYPAVRPRTLVSVQSIMACVDLALARRSAAHDAAMKAATICMG